MALFLAGTLLWALIWLLYRAYQVCQTPNEILVEKLGLDIPPSPDVTLEEINAREIRIAWKLPEFHNSIHKHIIQVNGVKVGESKRAETAVAISNLIPGNIYHVCVFAVSAANFQTSSAVLHVRTKRVPLSQSRNDEHSGEPTIRAYIPRSTPGLTAPSAPLMAREQSGGQLQSKRASGGRKSSPAALGPDHGSRGDDLQKSSAHDDADETLEQLADRLKYLQQENENLEKQMIQDEKEHESTLKELEEQRDELKQRVKEKDEASGDLRKHVNKLESVNRTVQSEKSKRERLLQQKESERKKRQADIKRWAEQISRMEQEIAKAKEDKARAEVEKEERAGELRGKIAEEQAEMKTLDDDIQAKGGRIKKLEEERRRLEGDDNEDGKELDRIDRERDRQWEIKLNKLRAQYATLVSVHTQAQQQYHEAQERLKWITSQRPSSSDVFAAVPTLELDLSRNPSFHRRTRHRSSLQSNMSSPVGFPLVDPNYANTAGYNVTSSGSPTFGPSSAFFNINNGMTIPPSGERPSNVRSDPELVSSIPPMSPRADALLPSDLLGDEDPAELSKPSSDPFSSLGPSIDPFDTIKQGSPSPVSSESRSASIFASPHESLNNLQDTNRQAEHMSNVTFNEPGSSQSVQSASRRLSGLFGFHRQRGKTVADGPPLLGTLKGSQSQSFPRNLEGLDPIGTRVRRSSYSSNWANPMANLFPHGTTTTVTADSSSDRIPSRRSAFPSFFTSGRFGSSNSSGLSKASLTNTPEWPGYNQFSPKHDPIDPSILGTVRRGSSPRPPSTYSFDKGLPRPTKDSQPFGWPVFDKIDHRSSLGVDWSSPSPWSRSQSRRPSLTMGSSGHLPLGLPGDSDVFPPFDVQRQALQAPIGTRPPSSHRPATPKLNPAAPSFKTLFTKKFEKDKDKGKGKEGDGSKSQTEFSFDDSSPPASRRSRDSRSLTASAAESYDSLERVPSSTPSDSVGTKESFIQKITRKSSSSKFNLSWKDRAGLFSKKGDTPVPGETDEEHMESQLGKSLESVISSTPSADRSTKGSLGFGFMRKSKKADKTASEASEKASETGDEEVPEEV